MKKILLFIVGVLVVLFLALFNISKLEKTYPIECIGYIEFEGLLDNVDVARWVYHPEIAIKYLDEVTSETGVSEESKKVRALLEKMNSDEFVLVSVGVELDCISICEHEQGYMKMKSDTLRINRIYFYTSEFDGEYCRYYM